MRPYQEEYIANISEIDRLTQRKRPGNMTLDQYTARLRADEAAARALAQRNMELLRGELFPRLDLLFEADGSDLADLEEFAGHLAGTQDTRDEGLFRLIHQALLSLARRRDDRDGVIRECYWLGMGRFWLCSKLVGLDLEIVENYISQMRLCFTEAAAYLKYFDEIEDQETQGYILRARANMYLGGFKSLEEKIRLVRQNLRIMQDESYQAKAPGLPWDRFVYTIHQQMASCVSYQKEKIMTPDDMASVMESAYIVYQRRLQEAAAEQDLPPLRWAFPYYAMEYSCGLYDLSGLLARTERLLEAPEMTDWSPDSLYGMLSLPAYYCQYLQQYPERIPGKAAYIDRLYRRALAYADRFPPEDRDRMFQGFRQLSYTYIETGSGIPFGQFLQTVLLWFAPELYIHSWIVGTAAKTLCGIILEEEPGFFDDMEEIRRLASPEEKRRVVLDTAMQSGLLHDVGKISLLDLYGRTVRQWFEEEDEVARLHVVAGRVLLSERESTRRFAPVAFGHHAWYDGSSFGYPEEYRRLECPWRQMVDVIGLLDWLEYTTHTAAAYGEVEMDFDEAVAKAVGLEGRQFSPLLTARLRDSRVTEQLRDAFAAGSREAYRHMYEWEKDREQNQFEPVRMDRSL